MATPYSRLKDSDLLAWATNFATQVEAETGELHLTPAQSAAIASAVAAFRAALGVWTTPTTRTSIARQQKEIAREAMLAQARYLVQTITNDPRTTDAQRDALGIPRRAAPRPSPTLNVPPTIEFVSITGRNVAGRLRGTDATRRAWPDGVRGANVYTFVGPTAPADIAMWGTPVMTTRTAFEIAVPGDEAATIWVTANFFSNRGETSPACPPRSVNVAATSLVPATARRMKLAA